MRFDIDEYFYIAAPRLVDVVSKRYKRFRHLNSLLEI